MHTVRNDASGNTNNFWTNLASTTPRMAVFMKITPALNTGLSAIGLTSNTRDMTLSGHAGITFKSAAGLMPSSFEQAMEEPTTLEMTGIFDSVLFKRTDVLGGKWENARVEIFIRSWDSTAVTYGEILIFSGFLGEFRDYQLYFKAEGRGLLSKLSQDAVWVTSRGCRVKNFRDSQCGHTASTVTIDAVTYDIIHTGFSPNCGVTSCSNTWKMSVNKTFWTGQSPSKPVPPSKFFLNGIIECLTGANAGLKREVSDYVVGIGATVQISLKRPFPYAFTGTDTFRMTAGCNRTIEDCKKYSNAVNFRGEPFVPGLTTVSKVPSADEV